MKTTNERTSERINETKVYRFKIQNHQSPLFMKCLNKFSPFIHIEIYSRSILCWAVAVVVVFFSMMRSRNTIVIVFHFTYSPQYDKMVKFSFEWWSVYCIQNVFAFWLYYSCCQFAQIQDVCMTNCSWLTTIWYFHIEEYGLHFAFKVKESASQPASQPCLEWKMQFYFFK